MALGKRVKALREGLGLTLEQLADRSGVDLGTIGALEVRDSSRSKYAAQLATALGVTLEDLLGDSDIADVRPVKNSHSWPFSSVSIERILALSTTERAEVESDLRYSVEKAERRSTKKSTASKRSAA